MVSHSPKTSEDGSYEFTRSVRCGASVGSFTDLVVDRPNLKRALFKEEKVMK